MRACPRSREENGGEGTVAWPFPLGDDFSLSVSLSLSGEWTCLITKTSQNKTNTVKPNAGEGVKKYSFI